MHRRTQITLNVIGNNRQNYIGCIMTTPDDSVGRSTDAQTVEALVEQMKPFLIAVIKEKLGLDSSMYD